LRFQKGLELDEISGKFGSTVIKFMQDVPDIYSRDITAIET
jgi:hypothetical protein